MLWGWYGTTKTIGYSATPSTDYIADGVTRVFYIKCNLSGISYNKYIPTSPSNFEWAYKLIDMEDVWRDLGGCITPHKSQPWHCFSLFYAPQRWIIRLLLI